MATNENINMVNPGREKKKKSETSSPGKDKYSGRNGKPATPLPRGKRMEKRLKKGHVWGNGQAANL